MVARDLRRLQIADCELRLVVEHFFEVRNEPFRVHRVAVKAAPDMIVDAALGHFPQSERRHFGRLRSRCSRCTADRRAEQEVKHRRPGEFRRPAESAPFAVKRSRELFDAPRDCLVRCGRQIGFRFLAVAGGRGALPVGAQGLHHARAFHFQFFPVVGPRRGEDPEECREPRPAPAVFWREIGAAKERFEAGRQPYAHRPPAVPSGRLHVGHVDPVDIGPLLPIDFHRYKVAIELRGDGPVLERLVRHHVTPMTGRVSDGEEDGLLLDPRPGEGFLAPGEPVDGVIGVLAQIGRLFAGEAVGLAGRGGVGH